MAEASSKPLGGELRNTHKVLTGTLALAAATPFLLPMGKRLYNGSKTDKEEERDRLIMRINELSEVSDDEDIKKKK